MTMLNNQMVHLNYVISELTLIVGSAKQLLNPWISRRSVAISLQGELESYRFCLTTCLRNICLIASRTYSDGMFFSWKFAVLFLRGQVGKACLLCFWLKNAKNVWPALQGNKIKAHKIVFFTAFRTVRRKNSRKYRSLGLESGQNVAIVIYRVACTSRLSIVWKTCIGICDKMTYYTKRCIYAIKEAFIPSPCPLASDGIPGSSFNFCVPSYSE
jgi:hypothetical protein